MLSTELICHDLNSYLNGLEVKAPTGHTSIIFPESSEVMPSAKNGSIFNSSPRPVAPISMMPAISLPKRTHRVQ